MLMPWPVPVTVKLPAVLKVALQEKVHASPGSSTPLVFVSPAVAAGAQVGPLLLVVRSTCGLVSGTWASLVSVKLKVTLSPLWTSTPLAPAAGEVVNPSVVLAWQVL